MSDDLTNVINTGVGLGVTLGVAGLMYKGTKRMFGAVNRRRPRRRRKR
jgi:hypothetical protein